MLNACVFTCSNGNAKECREHGGDMAQVAGEAVVAIEVGQEQ